VPEHVRMDTIDPRPAQTLRSILRSSTKMTGTYCQKSFHRVTSCTRADKCSVFRGQEPQEGPVFSGDSTALGPRLLRVSCSTPELLRLSFLCV
jgi:hypothetical protein